MKHEDLFFHLSSDGIFGYTMRVLDVWNIRRGEIRKSLGGSWYIKLELGTIEQPNSLHIRISDHDAVHKTSKYDYDVMCAMRRDGVHGINPVTYLRLLEILADRFGREIPPLCQALREHRREHTVRLQYNRRHQTWRTGKNARFYVKN
jgi:hypothetical protein